MSYGTGWSRQLIATDASIELVYDPSEFRPSVASASASSDSPLPSSAAPSAASRTSHDCGYASMASTAIVDRLLVSILLPTFRGLLSRLCIRADNLAAGSPDAPNWQLPARQYSKNACRYAWVSRLLCKNPSARLAAGSTTASRASARTLVGKRCAY